MNVYTHINQATWNDWTLHHTDSEHHRDVVRFLAAGSSLRSIELAEVGDVTGKRLLHLQCNMGCDTLSWARRGAQVTGVDIAEAAVDRARSLATETGLPARFIAGDLYALPDVLDEQFDIVYTSYGVLWWLADLPRWAEIAARYVAPGGRFYIVDMHPSTNCLSTDDGDGRRLTVTQSYTHTRQPLQVLAGHDEAIVRTWPYGLGEVVTNVIAAGLQLDYLHEFPQQFYRQFAALVQDDEGWWRWPKPENTLPLLFSLMATKR